MSYRALIVGTLLFLATSSGATVFNVDSTLDEIDAVSDGNCVSTPSGYCTLRAAIMEANVDAGQDTINLPAGLYTLSINGTGEDAAEEGDLDLRASVTIKGAGTAATIVDADGIDRVFEVIGENVIIQDLTIRNGSAITAGSATGGGVLHRGPSLWLGDVRLTGNLANAGGGLMVGSNCFASIQECIFDNNSLIEPLHTNSRGAAIYNSGGSLSLVWSTVTNNTNASGATAVVFVEDCTSTVAIHNSTIAHNSAGAVYSYNCNFTLRNTTIAGNAGNGFAFGVTPGFSFSVDAANSVFSDNSSYDCQLYSGGSFFQYCLDSDDTCGLLPTSGNLPTTDPVLLPLRNWGGANDTMYPKPGASPLIDSGLDSGVCLAQDQRFVTRPVDGDGNGSAICDMGAVEAGDLILWSGFENGTTDEWLP